MTNPIRAIKDIVNNIQEISRATRNVVVAANNLKETLADTQTEVSELQKKIDEFNFKSKPRLERIKQLQTHMQSEVDRLNDSVK